LRIELPFPDISRLELMRASALLRPDRYRDGLPANNRSNPTGVRRCTQKSTETCRPRLAIFQRTTGFTGYKQLQIVFSLTPVELGHNFVFQPGIGIETISRQRNGCRRRSHERRLFALTISAAPT
jgi:hypothetical protein